MAKMKWFITLALCWTIMVEKPERVIDGDTFIVMANIWIKTYTMEIVRVLDVDAVERDDPGGPAATAFTTAWLQKGPFTLMTCRRDSFGRILSVVSRGSEMLAEELEKNGHTKKKENQEKP